MSPLMNHFVRRAVPCALSVGALTAALAACDSTTLTSSTGDKVIPSVTLSVDGVKGVASKTDSVNVRSMLSIAVNASDNAALQSVVTSIVIDGAVLRTDSVAYTTGLNTVSRTSKLSLGGVRTGQTIVIRAAAYDAGGN